MPLREEEREEIVKLLDALQPTAPYSVTPASPPAWPDPLEPEAFQGLAGEIVNMLGPTTEADPAALLVQLLVAFGNSIGPAPHFNVCADRHGTNLFCTLVGKTSKARKGTALSQVKKLFEAADPAWVAKCVKSGLSSGEGLISAVCDPIEKRVPVREKGKITHFESVIENQGVDDKRLLIVEPEFASTLQVMTREGSTLSAIVRQAWDSGELRVITRNSPVHATGAHISMIAHITKDELLRCLGTTEMANGFANRFLFVCVQRSKFLPDGGEPDASAVKSAGTNLGEAITFARSLGRVTRDASAQDLWRKVYNELSAGEPGLLGGIVSRAEVQVLRLSILYALLDLSAKIRVEHLKAAIAVWDYCEQSARYIFGDSVGDPVADDILRALRASADGLSRSRIHDLFGRHKSVTEIGRALSVLLDAGLARHEVLEATGGRPLETWYAGSRIAKEAKLAKKEVGGAG